MTATLRLVACILHMSQDGRVSVCPRIYRYCLVHRAKHEPCAEELPILCDASGRAIAVIEVAIPDENPWPLLVRTQRAVRAI